MGRVSDWGFSIACMTRSELAEENVSATNSSDSKGKLNSFPTKRAVSSVQSDRSHLTPGRY